MTTEPEDPRALIVKFSKKIHAIIHDLEVRGFRPEPYLLFDEWCALASALDAALTDREGWREIESAPKDGTEVLTAYAGHAAIHMATWCSTSEGRDVMTSWERWWLRRLLAREVRQGYDHDKRITTLYTEIRRAAEAEFSEDNKPTRDSYLREWFEASL